MDISDSFALKYYGFLPVIVVTGYFIYYMHDPFLAFLFIGFENSLTNYLYRDSKNTKFSKELNKNALQVFPLVLSCLMTPIMLCVYWNCYDEVIGNSLLHWFASLVTLSFTVGGSIDASHELLHRYEWICKVICYVNLWFYQFTVYPIEHLYMHHKKVGTTEDPVTSPKDQSVYKYYVKVISSAYSFNYHHNFTYFLM